MKYSEMSIKKQCLFFVILFLITSCSNKKHIVKIADNRKAPAVTLPLRVDTVTTEKITETYYSEVDTEMYYPDAYEQLRQILEDEQPLSFKKAVYTVENAWFENRLDYSAYHNYIATLVFIIKEWNKSNQLADYFEKDKEQVALSRSIFVVITDTVKDDKERIVSIPYRYDFNDCFAKQNWTNMFVTKLMVTHKGNCHSLPFLFKILAEELGVKAYLSYAPNHIFIKQYNKKTSWYNVELTNGQFPNDGWVMATGYVSTASIVSGMYMDTLGLKQSVAVCVNDLAKGYKRKYKNYDEEFVLKCCRLGLKYYPNFAELLLLKAETLKSVYDKEKDKIKREAIYKEMEEAYATLVALDYRELTDEMYREWMTSLERDKSIYQDKEANSIFKR